MPIRIAALVICSVIVFTASSAPAQLQRLGPKDTFTAAGLSAREIKQIVDGVEPSAYDTPDSWSKELRVKRVDLGGSPGLVVQGTQLLCGGTGNCQTWVFRKSDNKWTSLIGDEQAPIADGFQFGPGATNGIKDFTITANSSAEAGTRVTYKFDGKSYRAE